MSFDLAEWLNLAIRWLHLTAGIAWIGSSFYFVWLDNHLTAPAAGEASGELWSVHGGGFYHNQKYQVAPSQMPDRLHWFKWEAYFTWISGFSLLVLIYYVGAQSFLIDPAKAALSPAEGIAIGLASLAAGWIAYDLLCRSSLGSNNQLLGIAWFLCLLVAAYGLDTIFSARAAYMHVGAIIGTVMVANVFFVIIPNQRKVVADLIAGRTPDPALGKAAKQRSLHNNYMTLPVLFIMISNHYPMTYGAERPWLVLALLGLTGVAVRHVFNLRHRGQPTARAIVLAAVLALVSVTYVTLEKGGEVQPAQHVTYAGIQPILATHCTGCHSPHPTNPTFAAPPLGVKLDSYAHASAVSARIKKVAVDAEVMPLGNKTGMTKAERQKLGAWIASGDAAMIRFVLDGRIEKVDATDPTATVLDLLRNKLRRTGTKEGCAEGDCGACTVVLGELDGDRVRWRAVNACILFVPMLDGKALVTVESLSKDGDLHPVQRAMADGHGSQCGFCTPGFVMSLYARTIGGEGTEGTPVKDVIAGNLCRCTGYGPILAAGEANPMGLTDDGEIAEMLRSISSADSGPGWFAPRSSDSLAALLVEHPDARIVAGATDVGLWVTKAMRNLGTMTFIGDVADLKTIKEDASGLTLGAGVRYSEAKAALGRLHPDLGELVRRIGGLQVRNAGTIGGNIANGSPIGDMPPALIALGAELTLRRGNQRRTMPLEAYFKSYGVQDRQPGEFVESVFIPRPAPDALIHIAKLSKRFDSDISALCGAFMLHIENGLVASARIAFGGMAGIPARALACEAAMIGQPLNAAAIEAAAKSLTTDYQPLSDLRGSSEYRLTAAANLLRRLGRDEPVSVLDEALDG